MDFLPDSSKYSNVSNFEDRYSVQQIQKGKYFIILKDLEEFYLDNRAVLEKTFMNAFDSATNIVYLNEYGIYPSLFESISINAAIVGLAWRIFRIVSFCEGF